MDGRAILCATLARGLCNAVASVSPECLSQRVERDAREEVYVSLRGVRRSSARRSDGVGALHVHGYDRRLTMIPCALQTHRVGMACWKRRRRTMQTRGDLTLVGFFAVLLALTIVLAYGSPLFGQNWTQVMAWLQVILPVETLLLGSTVGFYFGNRR
jgi:hypothetical protein